MNALYVSDDERKDTYISRIDSRRFTINSQGGLILTLVMDLLRRFSAEHDQDATMLNCLIEQGQTRDAGRALHTLKGLAGTLGFLKLQEYAAKARHSVRYQSHVAQLKAQLNTMELELCCEYYS